MACKNYVAATATKGKDPAQDSSIKFFRFLAKFGAKYEDLFPENWTVLSLFSNIHVSWSFALWPTPFPTLHVNFYMLYQI